LNIISYVSINPLIANVLIQWLLKTSQGGILKLMTDNELVYDSAIKPEELRVIFS